MKCAWALREVLSTKLEMALVVRFLHSPPRLVYSGGSTYVPNMGRQRWDGCGRAGLGRATPAAQKRRCESAQRSC